MSRQRKETRRGHAITAGRIRSASPFCSALLALTAGLAVQQGSTPAWIPQRRLAAASAAHGRNGCADPAAASPTPGTPATRPPPGRQEALEGRSRRWRCIPDPVLSAGTDRVDKSARNYSTPATGCLQDEKPGRCARQCRARAPRVPTPPARRLPLQFQTDVIDRHDVPRTRIWTTQLGGSLQGGPARCALTQRTGEAARAERRTSAR